MFENELDLSTLELSYEDIYTPDWRLLLTEAQREIDRKTQQTMASFELPIESMEDPMPVYRKANRFGKAWMRWMLDRHPLEIGEMMILDTLAPTVQEVNERALDRWMELQDQMAKADPELTEEMKNTDMMRWVGIMNNIRSRAAEIVISELTPIEE